MPDTVTSVITLARRVNLRKITSGAVSTIAPVTHIAFGDGGLDAQGNPLQPTEKQTSLKHEIARYPVEGVANPSQTTARYTAVIPKGDLAGESISEAALVDSDGALCAIKNMYAKRKDGDVVFTFTFDDEF